MNNQSRESRRPVWPWMIVALALGWMGAPEQGWEGLVQSTRGLADRAREMFPQPDWESAQSLVWLPGLIVLGLCGGLLLWFRQPPDRMRLPVALGFLALQAGYLSYRLLFTLCLDSAFNAALSLGFFLSELFIHFRMAVGNLSLLALTDRREQADDSQRAVRAGRYLPSVDIFVPTYSEPVEMLRRSLIGCQAVDYPRKTIYLLDDQRRESMCELAREVGCQYLDRPDNQHAKAGNLNQALPRSGGELIACFDADFIPTRDFLERTVGFFRDPQVALVQTPQNFFNEDAVTRNLGLERAVEDEQRLFFRTLQPGRDSANAIVCHGSCFVIRRSALEAIGGIPTETITEDWATSIKLQAAGYKLYYLNEALSAGMSADRCGEFIQQRARWAQGTLQSLFASTNPLTVPGLNWRQRLMHFGGIIYYLGSLSSLFNLVAPLFFLFLGGRLLRMTVAEMIFYRLPLILAFYLLYSWLTRRTRSGWWTEFYESFLAPTMALTVLRTFCRPFAAGFRVTDKVIRKQGLSLNRRVAFPFALLLGLHLAGIAFALLQLRQSDPGPGFWIGIYFAGWNVLTLWVCLLASVDVAQKNSGLSFEHRLPGLMLWDDTGDQGETLRVGESEVLWRRSCPNDGSPPGRAVLHLPAIGLHEVPVRVEQQPGSGEYKLVYEELDLRQRRALIGFLFCRAGQWDRAPRSEWKSAAESLRAPWRIYPLAEAA